MATFEPDDHTQIHGECLEQHAETGVEVGRGDCEPDEATEPETFVGVDVRGELAAIADQLQAFHERSRAQEERSRLMQARIEELTGDQTRQLLKPVIERLATLHGHAHSYANQEGSGSAEDFRHFADMIEETLDLLDIVSIEAKVGDPVVPQRHHVTRTIATPQHDMHNTIHKVRRQGFAYAGAERVILAARVDAFRHEVPAPVADETSAPTVGDTHNNDE